MEVDIAPQFGAELKVGRLTRFSTAHCPVATDRHSIGWLQKRQCLGTSPAACFLMRPRLTPTTTGFWRHRMARRHPALLSRAQYHREGICRQAQCAGQEVLREKGKESEQPQCWRHTHHYAGLAGEVPSLESTTRSGCLLMLS